MPIGWRNRMSIFSVYIEDGCITCDACEEAAPDVFEVTDDTCFIKPDARIDGGYDRNTEKSGLKPDVISTLSDDIMDAADACPVDVIILVEESEEDTPETEVTEVAEPEAESVVEESDEPAEGLEGLLSSGDRTLNIMFGSQSGNSEELAAKFAKRASDYGLEATVHDMDGFDLSSLSSMKRVLIICSTWGEGDMPDNAEELWLEASSDSASRLDETFFSVLALGDTSYELFCQSGKDWDERLEQLGATRLFGRVDCDVDYDAAAEAWALDALATMAAVDGNGTFLEDQVETIKDHVSGTSVVASGEDGFTVPSLYTDSVQVEISIFRYNPERATTGRDTWVCALPGNLSVMGALRALKDTHDGSLTFRDGPDDDPTTAISVNGRLILPGCVSIDSAASTRGDSLQLRIEPLPAFDVIRDLVVDLWPLERSRESAKPWMIAATRQGANTSQGVIGTMDPIVADLLHSITDFCSAPLLHSSSDATPHSDDYMGPAVLARTWARMNDPRSSARSISEMQEVMDSQSGIKAETDFASIRRQNASSRIISEALLDARTSTLSRDAFNGRHGKHVWWYSWSVKSSGRVNDTVLYRQVLGPLGLFGNLFSGVTARMVLGFTRTGGNAFNGMLGMVAPPAGIGKMPKQFNSSVDNHHEVVAIFNEVDGRF
ncbi:MAG: flavodoxin domain-containing protein [Candidatus Thermoplasmatota archaeon]|nr:flavodoxin domain-containing protein [Candidatus Thermoplasmatota archaeon]